MDRPVLNGSMRGNMEKIRAYMATLHMSYPSLYPSLPTFCPECDYTHERKLWFRRAHSAVCYRCGYKLQPKDYWHSEFDSYD